MKKPYKHIDVDYNQRCIDCNKPLKKNVLSRVPHANKCYCCNNISKGKLTVTKNRYKLGKLISTKDEINLNSANGRLMFRIKLAMNCFYVENLIQKIRVGVARAKAEGKYKCIEIQV